MEKVWKQSSRADAHYSAGKKNLIETLLANRGIMPEDAAAFLEPKYETSHDPFLLKDMDLAVARIKQGVAQGEKITVYADYDADAVTAAAVLLRYFQQIGYTNCDYYIPDREAEGYGMNLEAIKLLAERGTKLIITVDCGINAIEVVELAKELEMTVIITDHHQLTPHPSSPTIPNAVAVINPHRPDDEYPFKDLTGVGVAFKLVQALAATMTPTISPPHEGEMKRGSRGFEKWLLDLVAIGTVADCQSLLGENRVLVKWGLLVLRKTRWVGLRELLDVAGIAGQEMDTYKIGFLIAPRINAAGRIEHANLALELLLTDDRETAARLAEKLQELNQRRQKLTAQILSEARTQLAAAPSGKILLAAGNNWPKGIVGLVAGKLTEEFYRPVLVLERGEQEATGSARSIGSFNIIEAISESREILLRFGGHAQAAGFTLKSEHIEIFHKNLLRYAEENLQDEMLSPVLYYDAEINLEQISAGLVEFLEKLAPYGAGNPRPRFRINNVLPKNLRILGTARQHLKLKIENFDAIAFGLGFWGEKLVQGGAIDIICEPQWNDWNGQRNIQLKVVDLQVSNP